MTRKKTNKEFLQELKDKNINAIPIEEYKSYHEKIKVKFDCGHECFISPAKLLGGGGCGLCKGKTISKAKITSVKSKNIKQIEELGYEVLSEYTGFRNKITVKNKSCGHIYEARIGNILKGSGCPKCSGHRTSKEFEELIEKKYPGKYRINDRYTTTLDKISVTHLECGYTWETIPKDLLRSERCPNCIKSKGERFVKSYLEKAGIEYKPQYSFDDCRRIFPLPFDFAIFINGKIALIEFDGSQHFKNSSKHWGRDNFSYVKENDEIKNNYCKNKKIPLFRIPYWWIRNDKAERELDAFIKNLNDYRNTGRA